MITRAQIAQMLVSGPVTVTFTKVDGSERVMNCTQAFNLIPEDKHPPIRTGELLTEVPQPSDQMRVFDLDVGDWRSFRVSSVKEVTVVNETPDNRLILEHTIVNL